MARGRKSYTPEEELEVIKGKMESLEDELKKHKTRKKELEKSIIEQEMSGLYDAVKQSGKSVADIISMLAP